MIPIWYCRQEVFEMKISTEEELLKKVGLEKMMTIERFRRKEPFEDERRYEAEWELISSRIYQSFSPDKNGVELSLKWKDIKAEHKNDFITRLKAIQKQQKDLRF